MVSTTTKTSETSTELLAYMALYRDDEPQEAQEAFNVFYHRYCHFLTAVVAKNCPKGSAYYDNSLVETTVHNTFYKAYLRAETFKPNVEEDGAKVEHRVKAWLSGIAKNELWQLLKITIPYLNNHKLTDDFESSDPLELPAYLQEDEPTSLERDLIDRALASLPEREKDVLLTYTRFDDGRKQLPKEEIERLATLFDTTSDYLRQIRLRAFKKVKDFIKANSDFDIE
ncbi:MAG: sigma-70 family RNA polymerase sigma factor [Lewinellaceae bacterium]|nr:sigma-70 family RNA polymerase sigma factor [Lewinellaceae bacterium]